MACNGNEICEHMILHLTAKRPTSTPTPTPTHTCTHPHPHVHTPTHPHPHPHTHTHTHAHGHTHTTSFQLCADHAKQHVSVWAAIFTHTTHYRHMQHNTTAHQRVTHVIRPVSTVRGCTVWCRIPNQAPTSNYHSISYCGTQHAAPAQSTMVLLQDGSVRYHSLGGTSGCGWSFCAVCNLVNGGEHLRQVAEGVYSSQEIPTAEGESAQNVP